MIHAYIAHPLNAPTREEIEWNRSNASKWVGWAGRQGVAPLAMWIVMSGEWDETAENRERGLLIDEAQVELCSELWLVGGRVSSGMQRERRRAEECGRFVIDLTWLGLRAPEYDMRHWLGERRRIAAS